MFMCPKTQSLPLACTLALGGLIKLCAFKHQLHFCVLSKSHPLRAILTHPFAYLKLLSDCCPGTSNRHIPKKPLSSPPLSSTSVCGTNHPVSQIKQPTHYSRHWVFFFLLSLFDQSPSPFKSTSR